MIRIDRQPGETQAEFCERCHRTLEQSILHTDQRNAACLQMCRDAGFDDPTPVQRFSEREFSTVRDVPVFAEHTTKDRDGNLVVYDRNALAAIADRCNERIADTGDFPPITEGHTPTKEEMAQGAKMPPVLGYAGNFRLGQIGNKNPRWAIFCDEYHHVEDRDKLRKLRRRSPEVWLEDAMEDRFFDPIAALGAETPRLDMGMARFARTQDGRVVEKYTAVAPAAATTFVPDDELGEDDTDNYQAEGTATMLTPEDINQVVEALMSTDAMQWVQSQMAGGDMPGAEPAPEPDPAPGPEMGGDVPPAESAPAAPAEPAPAKPPFEPDDEDKAAFSRYMAGEMDDEEMSQYMCDRKANYQAGDGDDPGEDEEITMGTDSYSRQRNRIEQAKYAKLEERTKALETQLAAERTKARKAERYSKLSELQNVGYQLDPQEELNDTESLSDEQFEKHLDRITKNYSRIPLEGAVPRLFAPDLQKARENEQQTAKYAREARDRVLKAREAGQNLTYEQALADAKKESTAATA